MQLIEILRVTSLYKCRVDKQLKIKRMEQNPRYIAYYTPWSEGTVVVHTTDRKFAMGVDPAAGNVIYGEHLPSILEDSVIVLETTDMHEAVIKDSTGYPRYPIDYEEGALYNELLKKEWSKSLDDLPF
jgi:hypothetical protein